MCIPNIRNDVYKDLVIVSGKLTKPAICLSIKVNINWLHLDSSGFGKRSYMILFTLHDFLLEIQTYMNGWLSTISSVYSLKNIHSENHLKKQHTSFGIWRWNKIGKNKNKGFFSTNLGRDKELGKRNLSLISH